MINYTNPKTGYTIEKKEINECLTQLVIFCNMNAESSQVAKLKNKLEAIEASVNKGFFKN